MTSIITLVMLANAHLQWCHTSVTVFSRLIQHIQFSNNASDLFMLWLSTLKHDNKPTIHWNTFLALLTCIELDSATNFTSWIHQDLVFSSLADTHIKNRSIICDRLWEKGTNAKCYVWIKRTTWLKFWIIPNCCLVSYPLSYSQFEVCILLFPILMAIVSHIYVRFYVKLKV